MAGTFDRFTKAVTETGSSDVNYGPNSKGGPEQDLSLKEPPLKIKGNADRYDHQKKSDDYSQPGDLYRLMSEDQKQQLVGNIAGSLAQTSTDVQKRMIEHFKQCDADYGRRIEALL
jgi:catalase